MSGRKDYPVYSSQLEQVVGRLRGQMQNQRQELKRQMDAKISSMQSQMQGYVKQRVNFLHQNIQQVEANFQRDLQNMQGRLQSSIDAVRRHVDASIGKLRQELRLERENRQKTAEEWMRVQEFLLTELDRLQAGRFRPVEAQKHVQMRELMQQNMASGNFEAVIGQVQALYVDSFALRAELEIVNQQAAQMEMEIRQGMEFLAQALQNPVLRQEYGTSEGGKEPVEIDLRFWAEEAWKDLESRQVQLQDAVRDMSRFDIDALRQLRESVEATLQLHAEAMEEGLRRHFLHIASMDRQESIVEALARQGFEVIDNFFEQDDERKANVLLLENASGEKILVRVVPTRDGENIKISFSSLNPVTHGSRMRALNQAIGVQPREEPGYETRPAPPEDFDLERYRVKQKA